MSGKFNLKTVDIREKVPYIVAGDQCLGKSHPHSLADAIHRREEKMKRLSVLLAILLCPVLLVSACQGGNPLGSPNCRKGICIKVDLARSAKLTEDSTLTLTINSEIEEPEAIVYWQFTAPDVLLDGQPIEAENRSVLKKVQIKSRQTMTLTNRIRFPSEGYFQIVAHLITRNGGDVFDGFWVHVTKAGITPNPPPERGPGTPAPAIKVDKTETPRPRTPTLVPPPTRPPYP